MKLKAMKAFIMWKERDKWKPAILATVNRGRVKKLRLRKMLPIYFLLEIHVNIVVNLSKNTI